MFGERNLHTLDLPLEVVQASHMLPFAPPYLSQEACLEQIVSFIPQLQVALQLVESYFSHGVFLTLPIERSQVSEEVLPLVYRAGVPIQPGDISVVHLVDLGLFFSILACGAVLRPESKRSPRESEYDKFFHLAKAALNAHGIFDHGSLAACQAFLLLGACELHLGRGPARDTSWKVVGMGFMIGASVRELPVSNTFVPVSNVLLRSGFVR